MACKNIGQCVVSYRTSCSVHHVMQVKLKQHAINMKHVQLAVSTGRASIITVMDNYAAVHRQKLVQKTIHKIKLVNIGWSMQDRLATCKVSAVS